MYLCHPLVLSSPTLMMHSHMNLKFINPWLYRSNPCGLLLYEYLDKALHNFKSMIKCKLARNILYRAPEYIVLRSKNSQETLSYFLQSKRCHDYVTYGEQISTSVDRIPSSLNSSGIYTKFYTIGIFLIFDLKMTLRKEFINMRDLNSCYWRWLKFKSS